jgi:GNAT superfamily N-acetyltransferase
MPSVMTNPGRQIVPSERLERCFWRDIWKVAPLDAVRESGVEMRWFGPLLATVFAELPEAPLLNVIRGAGQPDAAKQGYLEEAIDWMQDWGVDFLLPVAATGPGGEQTEAWLNWHGYEQRRVSRTYVRALGELDPADAPGVEVIDLPEPVETEGMCGYIVEGLGLPELAEFLFCGLPRIPGWRCYSAYLEGYEVACGSMLIIDGTALLGLDATTPRARRRGCHRALLRRRLADAAAAGCHTAISSAFDLPSGGASAAALSLRAAGFVEACRSTGWQQPLHSRPVGTYSTWLR